ncbi:hypothetical protein BGZ60DRAFT_899 [Tricladium varicosporioides]|nr:hypothetical protein BGZ60DRAFT_899 [Hymenoscyphus varicosporioides]
MADTDDTLTEDGRPHSFPPRRSRLQRKEKRLFVQGERDHLIKELPLETGYTVLGRSLSKGSSLCSEQSSNITRRSSTASRVDYRRLIDAHPMESVPPPMESGSAGLNGLSGLPSDVEQLEKYHDGSEKIVPNLHISITTSLSPPPPPPPPPPLQTDTQRSQSPRFHIRSAKEKPCPPPPPPPHLGPMERFLAPDNIYHSRDDPIATLRSHRVNVIRLRLQLRTKRKELKDKEATKLKADETFMKFVREQMVSPSTFAQASPELRSQLDQYFAALQEARDEYGPSEYDYTRLEDLLDEAEFELGKLEGRFYDTTTDFNDFPTTAVSQPPPISPGADLQLSFEGRKEYLPLHAEYLSRLGDLDLARETYHNVEQELEYLLEEHDTRTKLGLDLSEDAQMLLRDLPGRKAELRNEISEIKIEVGQLRSKCLEEGIDIEESDCTSNSETIDSRPTDLATPDINKVPRSHVEIDHCMFPLLIPTSEDAKASLEDLITEFDEGNKSNRINRWLLYTLRTSPLELDLLVDIFLELAQILNFRQWNADLYQWQLSVLSWWSRDDANKSPEYFVPTQTHGSSSHSPIQQRLVKNRTSIRQPLTSSRYPQNFVRKARSAPGSMDLSKLSKESADERKIIRR